MTREEAIDVLNKSIKAGSKVPWLTIVEAVELAIQALSVSLPSDVDEAAEEYEDWVLSYSQADFPTCVSYRDAFKAGAEWQKKKDDELLTIAYMDGVADGKAKMLEEALHYVAQPDIPIGNILTPFIRIGNTALSRYGIKVGDKVRIIIVKED